MIWLAFAMLTLAAAIVVLPPLLKGARTMPRETTDLAVYRDQLSEIDGDAARGLISASEAEAARTEIKRRILALPQHEEPARTNAPAKRVAVAVAAGIIAISLMLYLPLGRPALPGQPYDATAERDAFKVGLLQEVDTMVTKLAARLEQQPNDGKGWRMLGWSYLQLGRISDGIAALKRAVALDTDNAALRSQLGEALVQQSDGVVTDEALGVFGEALKRDAKDPRARFYKGLALVQAGKEKEAFDLWVAIIREGPEDADWMPGLRAQTHELAVRLKLDPKTAVP
jgi:cytochrome c-type biogenesis protein CcmH